MEIRNYEESLRFATAVYLILGVGFFFTSAVYFEKSDLLNGFIFLIGGSLSFGVAVWAQYQVLFPVILGFILYCILVGFILYHYPPVENRGDRKVKGQVLSYLIGGLVIVSFALIYGFKKWKSKKKKSTGVVE